MKKLLLAILMVLSTVTINAAEWRTVVRVVDGDTVELDGKEKVRLIGVDTPEKYESEKLTHDAKETGVDAKMIQQLGELASLYTKMLCEGKMNSHDIAVVLQNYGGLRELFTAPYSELLSQPGMTAEAARTLMLVGGIVQKSRTLPRKRGQRISESHQVYSYFESLGDLATEALYAMLLDVQHQLVKVVKIAEGGATKVSVNLPDMLREAVATERVRNIILVHNHPSGSTKASVEDMRLTRTVALACQQFELSLIDHVIIAGDSYSAVKLK